MSYRGGGGGRGFGEGEGIVSQQVKAVSLFCKRGKQICQIQGQSVKGGEKIGGEIRRMYK
jgi:hypothetical protein